MNINSSLGLYGPSQIQESSLERTSKSNNIAPVTSEDDSNLVFSQEIVNHKSSLSQSIQNINGGILTTLIAQKGLDSQSEILDGVENEIRNTEEFDIDKKTQIARLLNKYDQISGIVGHHAQTPLKTSEDISENDLSIVSDETIIEIASADTQGISETLKSYLNDLNPSSAHNMLNDVNSGRMRLEEYKKDFSTAFEALNSIAKEYIESERSDSSSLDIDYAKESENFTKDNVLSKQGSFSLVQANTMQDRALPLMVS